MNQVKLLVDTGAGIPRELLERHNISTIPIIVVKDDVEYLEGNIDALEVIDAQKSGKKVTTSAPSVGDVLNTLEKTIADGYQEIIVITLQGRSSLTYNNIDSAATIVNDKYGERGVRVEVVDSFNVSMAQGFLVLRVAELLEQGATLQRVVDFARGYRLNTILLVALQTPKFAGEGGRVKALKAFAAWVLRLHPTVVVLPDTKAFPFGGRIPPRTMKIACEAIVEKAVEYKRPGARFSVVYAADAKERAFELRESLSKRLGIDKEEIPISEAPVALIVHAGHGAVGIAVDYTQPIQWVE